MNAQKLLVTSKNSTKFKDFGANPTNFIPSSKKSKIAPNL